MHGFTGKSSEVHKNNKIGFIQEQGRENKYDILFENIPEHEIKIEDGTDRRNSEIPPREKTEPA